MITAINLSNFEIAESAISKNALEIHYKQHYLKYVKNAQELTKESPWKNVSTKDIISIADPNSSLHNNVAQVYNHELFFNQFSNNPVRIENCFNLCSILKLEYKTVDNFINCFKENIIEKSKCLFGNGYLWVWCNKAKVIFIDIYSNDKTPIKYFKHITPLLNIDLWEHSYYLDYQSDKEEYVKNILKYIDWSIVENRLINI